MSNLPPQRITVSNGVAEIQVLSPKHGECFIYVDEADLPLITPHRWSVVFDKKRLYANSKINGVVTRIHRVLMGYPDTYIDHKDGDGLNNRRSNIRLATPAQNGANKMMFKNNTSGYRGVSYAKCKRKWTASIKVMFKAIYLGQFDSPEDAARAYDVAALKYFGEFCYLNFPTGQTATRESVAMAAD